MYFSSWYLTTTQSDTQKSKYLFQSAAMFPRMYIVVVYQMAVDRVIKYNTM
jgi:hypothetical protein